MEENIKNLIKDMKTIAEKYNTIVENQDGLLPDYDRGTLDTTNAIIARLEITLMAQ